jgi:CDP-diacylglycerol---glycerol-3-phosphate 3-phosphatidyltransferase
MTTATWITFSRLLGIPFIIYFLDTPTTQTRWLALTFLILAASTDWLDGYIARKFNQVSDLGKFLDPLVDKLLVLAPLLSLIEMDLIPGQAEIRGANLWGKLKTTSQIVAIAILIAPLAPIWYQIGMITFWSSLVLTIISGGIYVMPQVAASIWSSKEKSTSAS